MRRQREQERKKYHKHILGDLRTITYHRSVSSFHFDFRLGPLYVYRQHSPPLPPMSLFLLLPTHPPTHLPLYLINRDACLAQTVFERLHLLLVHALELVVLHLGNPLDLFVGRWVGEYDCNG